MSTYTGRRRGFDIPRQEQSSLSVYSMPAVNVPADRTAEQVSQVLAALGQTASAAASYSAQQQRELDLAMAGVADSAMATMLPRLQSSLANDPNLPDDDAGIDQYVTRIAESETAGLGLESSPRVLGQLKNAIRGRLASSAYSLRDERKAMATQGVINDIGAGLPSAAESPNGISEAVAAMRARKPDISDNEIQGYIQSAADSLAITGDEKDRGRLDNLLAEIKDPAQKAAIKGKFQNNVNAAKSKAKDEYYAKVDEGFQTTLRDRPYLAGAYLEGVKDTIPSQAYNQYKSQLDTAQEAEWQKTQKDARDAVINTIVEQGADAAGALFDEYQANGVLEPGDKIALSTEASQSITKQLSAQADDVAAKLRSGEISPAIAADMADEMGLEIERRNEQAISDPYSFGAVDPSVTNGLNQQIGKLVTQAYDQGVRDQSLSDGLAAIKSGVLWTPQSIPLSSGEYGAQAQADAVIASRFEEIQKQTNDPKEQLRLLAKDMSLVPLAQSDFIRSQISGAASLGYIVATETDPEKRQAAMDNLSQIVGNYSILNSVNPEVANRHLPNEEARDVLEYIAVASDLIPKSDIDAWRTAMGNVRQNRRLNDFMSQKEIDDAIDRTLKASGLGKNVPGDFRVDTKNRLEVYMVGLGMDVDSAVGVVGQSMRNTYSELDGGVLRSGNARQGKYTDVRMVRDILLETIPANERRGLRLTQERATGAYVLVDELGNRATEPISQAKAFDLIEEANRFASGITEQQSLAVAGWMDSEAAGSGPRKLYKLDGMFTRWAKSKVAKYAFKQIATGYAEGMVERTSDPLIRSARAIGKRNAGLDRPKTPETPEPANQAFMNAPGQ